MQDAGFDYCIAVQNNGVLALRLTRLNLQIKAYIRAAAAALMDFDCDDVLALNKGVGPQRMLKPVRFI